jgi:5-methylcytosine-specific restriction protein A
MPSRPRYYGHKGRASRPSPPRVSAARRGYGRTWQNLRLLQLNAEPLCEHCKAEGRTTAGAEVDHIVPLNDGGTNEPGNLQTLCKRCHSRKTAADVARRGGG